MSYVLLVVFLAAGVLVGIGLGFHWWGRHVCPPSPEPEPFPLAVRWDSDDLRAAAWEIRRRYKVPQHERPGRHAAEEAA